MDFMEEAANMDRKYYQQFVIIVASVFSVMLSTKIISEYGWVKGLISAAIIGAVVGIIGKILLKFLKIDR